MRTKWKKTTTTNNNNLDDPSSEILVIIIIVFCAGENDIGQNIRIDKSNEALQQLLHFVFEQNLEDYPNTETHLIFLGPKFEPWMDDDNESKQRYTTMSRCFQRSCCCQGYIDIDRISMIDKKNTIHFVDCITMFCTDETRNIPGAVLGGRAKANPLLFNSDKLHLNNKGYQIWKDVIEKLVDEILIANLNTTTTLSSSSTTTENKS